MKSGENFSTGFTNTNFHREIKFSLVLSHKIRWISRLPVEIKYKVSFSSTLPYYGIPQSKVIRLCSNLNTSPICPRNMLIFHISLFHVWRFLHKSVCRRGGFGGFSFSKLFAASPFSNIFASNRGGFHSFSFAKQFAASAFSIFFHLKGVFDRFSFTPLSNLWFFAFPLSF